MLKISDKIKQKLALRNITEEELEQCFINWEYPTLLPIEDTRPEHKTDPPTWWMISETDSGRRLKVVFMKSSSTPIEIKSAWDADAKAESDYLSQQSKQK